MRDRQSASIEAVNDLGNVLRVDFVWRHDRYAHSVVAVVAGREIPLLESIEGSDADDWPPSPPLQQLSIEPLRSGNVALLVGMAGKSHWSVSVEPARDRTMFVFDIACRLRQQVKQIGSGYKPLVTDWVATETRIELTAGDQRFCIQGRPLDEVMPDVRSDSGTLRLAPPATAEAPATVRWQYGVELLSGGGNGK